MKATEIRIGSRWVPKSGKGPAVMVREVNPSRNSIRLQEPSSCYTGSLAAFLASFKPEVKA